MASVKTINIFPNTVAVKSLDVTKINVHADKFEKTFESDLNTTLET